MDVYNDLTEQFLGDYTGIVNGPVSAYLVWTDARAAIQCAAVEAYRDAVCARWKTPSPRILTLPVRRASGNTDTDLGIVSH